MMALAHLQESFKRYLLAGDNEPELAAEIRRQCGISTTARLDVYRNAYYIRLEEALAHDFPAVLAVLGEADFGKLAAAYVSQQPSTRPSLRWLGQRFADFLLAAWPQPAASELARLEWAILHAVDAPDASPLAGLQDVPSEQWPGLTIGLHPSATLLDAHANVAEIRQAVGDAKPLPALRRAHEFLIVWRAPGGAATEALSPGAHQLLLALSAGHTLGEACEALAATLPRATEIPRVVSETLHKGAGLGWFAG